jgi:hypothetical protein
MAFDPDQFLKKTEPVNNQPKSSGGFDPDAFLAKTAPAENQREPFYGEGLLRGFVNTLPVVGGVAGGMIGAPLGPYGVMGGAGVGAGIGKSAENFIEGALGDEKTRGEIYGEPLKEGTYSALGEGIAPVAMSGLIKGGKYLGKGGRWLMEGLVPGAEEAMKSRFSEMKKAGSEALQEASSRLGINKLPEGMLTDNRTRQMMESSVSKSPTIPGHMIRENYRNIYDKLDDGAEAVFHGEQMGINDAGDAAKASLQSTITQKVQPAVDIYEELASHTPHIAVDSKITGRIVNNIQKMKAFKFASNSAHGKVKILADDISKLTTLDELRQLKSDVGESVRDAFAKNEGQMGHSLNQVYRKLVKAEQSAITRASLQASKNMKAGNQVAKKMISDIKVANKIYRGVSESVGQLAHEMGMKGVRSHGDFLNRLSSMSDEKVAETFWKSKNFKGMQFFSQEYPEAFEYIRKAKMGDIYNRSVVGEEVSTKALIRNAFSPQMTPESRRLLFGDEGVQVLEDMRKIHSNFGPDINPSGTQRGIEYETFNPFNPNAWRKELDRRVQYWILKNPDKASKIGVGVKAPMLSQPVRGLLNQTVTKPALRGLIGNEDRQ